MGLLYFLYLSQGLTGSMKVNELISKAEWDKSYENGNFRFNQKVTFQSIFLKHVQESASVFEFGCYPGTYLRFLGEKKLCKLNGIDYTTYLSEMISRFHFQGLLVNKIFQSDIRFLEPYDLKFDVVYSVGFIEHFDNVNAVLDQHLSFLKESGTLIVVIPNFRYFQYFLRKYLNSKTLEGHNLSVMDLTFLQLYCKKKSLEIVESGYYETCNYWVDFNKMSVFWKVINLPVVAFLRLINKLLHLPNKFTSPYMYLVAKKV